MDDESWVEDHRDLVHKIAQRVADQYRLRRYLDDLVGWGFEGLVDAREKFDESRGVSFSTYAWYRVYGRIIDGCRSMGWDNKIGSMNGPQIWAEHQAEQLQSGAPVADGRPGGLGEVAADLDAIVTDAANVYLLTTTLRESWIEKRSATPEEKLAEKRLAMHVREGVEALDERSRRVVEMSFFEQKTLHEIADALGYSVSWISRLRSTALKKLRRMLPRELQT